MTIDPKILLSANVNAINEGNIDHWDIFGQFSDPALQQKFMNHSMERKSVALSVFIGILLSLWIVFEISLDIANFTKVVGYIIVALVLITIGAGISLLKIANCTQQGCQWHAFIQGVFIVALHLAVTLKLLEKLFRTGDILGNEVCMPLGSQRNEWVRANASIILMSIMYEPRFYLVCTCSVLTELGLAFSHGLLSTEIIIPEMVRLVVLLIFFHQMQNRRLHAFLNHTLLSEMLDEREKNADAVHALEMRHMIGNVAHDLKTPLSAFLNGIDLVNVYVLQALERSSKGLDRKEEAKQTYSAIHSCLKNMYNANAFMLMEINRCVDYTKAIKGIKLTPKLETTDVREVMRSSVDVIMNIQEKVPVKLMSLGKEINPYVRTDKQWLQENILCLLSNAVKYATEGPVLLRMSLVNDNPLQATVDLTIHQLPTNCDVPSTPTPSERFSYPKDHSNLTFLSSSDEISAIPQQYLQLEVEDDGCGVSENMVQSVFSPFKQAKRLVGGTGLGLFSLAKRIESLGGSYGVDKRPGGKQGSVFWFTIPYYPDSSGVEKNQFLTHQQQINPSSYTSQDFYSSAAVESVPSGSISRGSAVKNTSNSVDDFDKPTSTPSDPSNQPPSLTEASNAAASNAAPKGISLSVTVSPNFSTKDPIFQVQSKDPLTSSYHVLVVDDSPTIVKLCSMTLKKLGFIVSTAENGAIALEKVEERWKTTGKEFDLILMDIQMPVMDGIEATKKIRELEKSEKHSHDENDTHQDQSLSSSSPSVPPSIPPATLSRLPPDNNLHITHQLIFGVSANSDQETIQEAFEAGVDDFLGKPFSMEALSAAFMKHLKELAEKNAANNNFAIADKPI